VGVSIEAEQGTRTEYNEINTITAKKTKTISSQENKDHYNITPAQRFENKSVYTAPNTSANHHHKKKNAKYKKPKSQSRKQ
jgi:hypothetical protein